MSGLHLLKRYQAETQVTQTKLADRSGLTQGYLALVLQGKRIPGQRGGAAIERATRGAVPSSAWLADLRKRDAGRKRAPKRTSLVRSA